MERERFHLCVCIPTYKRSHLLERLLRDLSLQTLLPDTLIVVDGDPVSGEVLRMMSSAALPATCQVFYVPSNHPNLAYQRYLGWRLAEQQRAHFLLYLDDDLRIVQQDAVENVIRPLMEDHQVVGVTALVQTGDPQEKFRDVPILRDRGQNLGPVASRIVRLLGSRTPPGGLTPSGHRRFPESRREYAPVEWLQGRVMAYRLAALTQNSFSADLFALTHIGRGKGEDTHLSHRVAAKGKMLLAFNATFLHPDDALPSAYPIQARRLAYAIAYSRRLLNENYRWPAPPSPRDRLALVRSYVGNVMLNWLRALARPARHRFAYAWGYTLGAARGLIQPPTARRLTPEVDWWQDAEEALGAAVRIGGRP